MLLKNKSVLVLVAAFFIVTACPILADSIRKYMVLLVRVLANGSDDEDDFCEIISNLN